MAATATSSRPMALASSAKVILLAFFAVKRVWQTVGRRGAREVWRVVELVWKRWIGYYVGGKGGLHTSRVATGLSKEPSVGWVV